MNTATVIVAQAAFGVVCLMLLWRFFYKPAILDRTRDHLFVLRDQLRQSYVEKGWGLDHKSYKALRDLINCHIRFTEHASLSRMIIGVVRLGRNAEVKAAIESDISSRFAGFQPEINDYSTDVRRRAATLVFEYAILTSFIFLVFAFIVGLVHVLARLLMLLVGRVTAPITAAYRNYVGPKFLRGIARFTSAAVEDVVHLEDERCFA